MPSSLASQIGAIEALTAFRPRRRPTRGGGAAGAAPLAGWGCVAPPGGAAACGGGAAPGVGAADWQAARLTRTGTSTANNPTRLAPPPQQKTLSKMVGT